MDFSSPVTDCKGIGEKTKKLFDACEIRTVGELLHYYPRNYDSFTPAVSVRECREGEVCAVRCRLLSVPALKYVRRYAILTGEATDGTDTLSVTWYNQPYLKNSLYAGREYVFRGHVRRKGRSLLMEQPAISSPEDYAALSGKLLPRYPLVHGLKNNTVIRAVQDALSHVTMEKDPMPASILERRGLLDLSGALSGIHFPENEKRLLEARRRLAYDEFFWFLMGIRLLKNAVGEDAAGIPMPQPKSVDGFLEALPYALTNAQQRVLHELAADMAGGRQMHRLIQGDVGSGKTILALLAMLICVENGYQAALMAPTQVLAAQHAAYFAEMTKTYHLPFRTVLLSGAQRAKERRAAYEAIAAGEVNCIIGTNALMQEELSYDRLGLVITDEQHRFGVRQREYLAGKGQMPHILVMSATPIPRTLALILYGDLQVSLLDELPAGRRRIRNAVVGPEYRERAWRFLAKEAAEGRQGYVICPMVEEGELTDAENVTDYADKLRQALPDTVRVERMHGRMKPEEKDRLMERFAAREFDVLVSTTVVEVGVNVPNATVMMIENAERYGLASLHQLRGRVGRGENQSYCIFVNTSRSEEAKERLEILNTTNDGFVIADQDLKLRGPGDLFGVRQSGEIAFRVADLYADADLLRMAAEDADALLTEDPGLEKQENAAVREAVRTESHIDLRTI
ncbi:MAG: ATP-dependent DNA helicase RecG [Lachnospiraceae bacterium]|nr:ATP-dependent DNA helicase RecG [Lachnospiraceae bacterium]